MKAILIYSGKGGVGKSTITYGLYKSYKEQGLKTIVLDMDLNTPSMHLLINNEQDLISNSGESSIFTTKSIIDAFVRSAIKRIKKSILMFY